jgi:hypothetical protein
MLWLIQPLERAKMESTSLWIIVHQRCSGLEVLTGGCHVLSVFSSRKEAETYLLLEGACGGWQVRETTCGELVSVLYGPCRNVEHVALDPLPDMVERVSLSCKAFVGTLLASAPIPPAIETMWIAS